ncbi:hypothetical protein ACWERY_02275 [Streptomyces sp. NPDC004082]
MATYTSRTITSTRHEWIVPTPEPWGAGIGDINAACAVACRAYRATHKLPEGDPLPDNAISFKTGDNEIIISFTREEPTP